MPSELLIADIGGSSSRWALCGADGTIRWWPVEGGTLPGYNPIAGDGSVFRGAIMEHFLANDPDALKVDRVLIYGAGCGSPDRAGRMRDAAAGIFTRASVEVRSDLLGAARSLYGGGQGLVLILGTGMNAGWFNGRELHLPMPSLGWLLGDEGGGVDLGRHLLREVLYRRWPAGLIAELFPGEATDVDQMIRLVHGSSSPAMALAAHARRLVGHMDHPEVRRLVADRFRELASLLAGFFSPEERAEARAAGSIAWAFRDPLAGCLKEQGMELTTVERDPLPGLVRYHQHDPPE